MSAHPTLPEVLAVVERTTILDALEVSDFRVSVAAKLLGVSRRGLYGKLAKYGIAARGIKHAIEEKRKEEAAG